jgi:hypothetical protein
MVRLSVAQKNLLKEIAQDHCQRAMEMMALYADRGPDWGYARPEQVRVEIQPKNVLSLRALVRMGLVNAEVQVTESREVVANFGAPGWHVKSEFHRFFYGRPTIKGLEAICEFKDYFKGHGTNGG